MKVQLKMAGMPTNVSSGLVATASWWPTLSNTLLAAEASLVAAGTG